MAESTGLEPVERKPVHGLAIRCITTLPTLHLWYGIICILSFGSGQHLFIKFTNLFNRYFACRHLSAKNKTNAKKSTVFSWKKQCFRNSDAKSQAMCHSHIRRSRRFCCRHECRKFRPPNSKKHPTYRMFF